MAQPQSRWVRFKRFLKRNMTPTWAKHFSYQVFSFLVSVAMVIGVANYAITRSYDERKLTFVDGFTITAHTGAFHTNQNSLEAVQAAIDHLSRNLWIVLGKLPDILPQFHTLFRLKVHNIRPLLRRERSGLRLGHGGQSRRLQFFAPLPAAPAQQEDHQQEHQEQHAASCGRVDHPGRDSLRYREHRLIRLVEGAD